MAGQKTYTVDEAADAWHAFVVVPPGLRARVRGELAAFVATLPECPGQGRGVQSRCIGEGYVMLIDIDEEKCHVTLLEVTRVK